MRIVSVALTLLLLGCMHVPDNPRPPVTVTVDCPRPPDDSLTPAAPLGALPETLPDAAAFIKILIDMLIDDEGKYETEIAKRQKIFDHGKDQCHW